VRRDWVKCTGGKKEKNYWFSGGTNKRLGGDILQPGGKEKAQEEREGKMVMIVTISLHFDLKGEQGKRVPTNKVEPTSLGIIL